MAPTLAQVATEEEWRRQAARFHRFARAVSDPQLRGSFAIWASEASAQADRSAGAAGS